MYDRVKKTIVQYGLIKTGDRVGIAVSGGADSMTLLHVLLRLSGEMGFEVFCLHFEHGIRGDDSKRDAGFVRAAAEAAHIVYLESSEDVPAYARMHDQNLEAAARERRYAFFENACQELGLNKIALGHHMDDQAETLLLNLIRGSGLDGLTGMDYFRAPVYIRPLLDVSRKDIEAYVKENGILHVEDLTNACLDYSRNYIRHEIMPSLLRLNPRAADAFCRSAALLREDNEVIQGLVLGYYEDMVQKNELGFCIYLKKYAGLSHAIRKHLLRKVLQDHFDLIDIEKQHIDRLDEFALTVATGKKMDIKYEVFATKSYGQLIISKKTYRIRKDSVFRLKVEGITPIWGGKTFRCDSSVYPDRFGSASDTVQYVDRDALDGACIRTRRPGDIFSPFGMAGHKTLKEAMIDLKIPGALRDEIPLVACGQEILWITGYALSNKLRIGSQTKNICRVAYFESENRGETGK